MNVDYCDSQTMPNCVGWSPFKGYAPYSIATAAGRKSMADSFEDWHSAVTADYAGIMAARAAFFKRRARAGDLWVTPSPLESAVQVIDAVQYPNNPSCPYPTPSPAPEGHRDAVSW
jgi:hypothetical protein